MFTVMRPCENVGKLSGDDRVGSVCVVMCRVCLEAYASQSWQQVLHSIGTQAEELAGAGVGETMVCGR